MEQKLFIYLWFVLLVDVTHVNPDSLPELRVAVFEIRGEVEKPESYPTSKWIVGNLGPMLTDEAHKHFGKHFNVTFIWTPDGSNAGVKIGPNNYTGALGLLNDNRADVMSWNMYEVEQVSQDFYPGNAHTMSLCVHAMIPRIAVRNHKLLTSIPIVPFDLMILLGVFTLITAVIIVLVNRRSFDALLSAFKTYKNLCRCYISQSDIKVKESAAQLVVSSFLMAITLYLAFYLNLINSELSSADFSGVVRSLDELKEKNEFKPLIVESDPCANRLLRSKDKANNDAYKGAIERENGIIKINTMGNLLFCEGNILIGSEIMCKDVVNAACMMNKEMIGWVSNREYSETFIVDVISRRMPEILRNKQSVVCESGYSNVRKDMIVRKALEHIGAKSDCVKRDIIEMFTDKITLQSISLYHSGPIFMVAVGVLTLLCLSLLLEKLNHMLHSKGRGLKFEESA